MAASGQPGVYLLQENGGLVEMLEQPYDSEALIQQLLSQHSSLLAGSQIDPDSPRKWLLISRECGIPGKQNGGDRWAVDHLFIDQDAIPTLVEVKRSTDSRIRREVVGQMLDYAANCILHWPIETLVQRFQAQCEVDKQKPAERLAAFLGDDSTPDAFWQAVKTNLQAGKIRFLFVADEIPSELRRVVEFLNQQMDPAEVLAIEVRQYVGQGLKTLVPRIMGQTAEAEQKKIVSARHLVDARHWVRQIHFSSSLGIRRSIKIPQSAMVRNWRAHACRSLLGVFFMLSGAAAGWAEMDSNEKYERDYNIFNPANQYRPDNPLNPAQAYSPNNPFNPVNKYDSDNPANPINQYNPNNRFNAVNPYNPANPLNPVNKYNPSVPFGPLESPK